MFPFPQPQAPFGGSGGMTSNQIPQPMQSGMPQSPQQSPMQGGTPQMVPSQNPMMPQGSGMPQSGMPQAGMPQAQGIDPQQLARLRMMLMMQQQQPQQQQQPGNLRAMLGM